MDALAGYGSDSDSSPENNGNIPSLTAGSGTLSGLLGNYSNDDGDVESEHSQDGVDEECADELSGLTDDQPKKRLRRWDNPVANANEIDRELPNILPLPRLLTSDSSRGDKTSTGNHFQALPLFSKDYTVQLRERISSSLKSQTEAKELPKEQQQLRDKLDKMFNTFQQHASTSGTSGAAPKSFATHLKEQHEFGNPHLFKDIIDHFQIDALASNVSNSFKEFEYVDRLAAAEERSRIAAANHQSSVDSDVMAVNSGS